VQDKSPYERFPNQTVMAPFNNEHKLTGIRRNACETASR